MWQHGPRIGGLGSLWLLDPPGNLKPVQAQLRPTQASSGLPRHTQAAQVQASPAHHRPSQASSCHLRLAQASSGRGFRPAQAHLMPSSGPADVCSSQLMPGQASSCLLKPRPMQAHASGIWVFISGWCFYWFIRFPLVFCFMDGFLWAPCGFCKCIVFPAVVGSLEFSLVSFCFLVWCIVCYLLSCWFPIVLGFGSFGFLWFSVVLFTFPLVFWLVCFGSLISFGYGWVPMVPCGCTYLFLCGCSVWVGIVDYCGFLWFPGWCS